MRSKSGSLPALFVLIFTSCVQAEAQDSLSEASSMNPELSTECDQWLSSVVRDFPLGADEENNDSLESPEPSDAPAADVSSDSNVVDSTANASQSLTVRSMIEQLAQDGGSKLCSSEPAAFINLKQNSKIVDPKNWSWGRHYIFACRDKNGESNLRNREADVFCHCTMEVGCFFNYRGKTDSDCRDAKRSTGDSMEYACADRKEYESNALCEDSCRTYCQDSAACKLPTRRTDCLDGCPLRVFKDGKVGDAPDYAEDLRRRRLKLRERQ